MMAKLPDINVDAQKIMSDSVITIKVNIVETWPYKIRVAIGRLFILLGCKIMRFAGQSIEIRKVKNAN